MDCDVFASSVVIPILIPIRWDGFTSVRPRKSGPLLWATTRYALNYATDTSGKPNGQQLLMPKLKSNPILPMEVNPTPAEDEDPPASPETFITKQNQTRELIRL